MSGRELAAMLSLAARWGASFLFMRLGAADFGALPLAALRVGGASAVLLPLLWQQRQWPALRRNWRAIALVGLVNSEPESFSGVPERRAKRRPIKAQSAAMARTMASICNDERASFGVMSGHERRLSGSQPCRSCSSLSPRWH